ncbi:hypothetical protein [Aurantiacibacter suaedae]|uniref:hypothetical protein n=1 Tax=Aurantiacibacter suaedae TaxID=2545755 RepID=UPI0010F61D62|nr:hypothetical protein [Aurantiacibacter suaedae]
MTAVSPSLAPVTGRHPSGSSACALRWAALTDAGQVVAMLAGVSTGRPGREIRDFPMLMRDAKPWRREAAERALDDLSAIMEPGIAALMAINARGGDCRSAAEALWSEFSAARAALLAMVPAAGSFGPLRAA